MTSETDLNRRRVVQLSALGAAGLIPAISQGAAPEATTGVSDPAARDFDLFFGSWRVQHRRLNKWLAGSTEWLDFDGTSEMVPLLGGLANMDDNIFNFPSRPFRGVAVRAFDPASRTWAIWWLDSRFPTKMDVPVVGTFKDGVGTFLADDTWEGKPVKVRFIWSRITRDSREWEQAFSPDGGKTWETNWTSSFRRVT